MKKKTVNITRFNKEEKGQLFDLNPIKKGETSNEIISINKRGEKVPSLTPKESDKTGIDYKNVVGQDSLTRFDKDKRKKNGRNKGNKNNGKIGKNNKNADDNKSNNDNKESRKNDKKKNNSQQNRENAPENLNNKKSS